MRSAVSLLALLALPVAAQISYAPISNKVCGNGGNQNIMPTLPRLDRKGRAVSSDLGSYPILSGTGAPLNVTFTSSGGFNVGFSSNSPFQTSTFASPDGAPNTLVAYIDGVGLYFVLGLVMTLASIVFTAAFCIGRYCCCCCSRTNCCCVCFQCCAHEPTIRLCGCGAVEVEASDGDGGAPAKRSILMGPARTPSIGDANTVRYAYPRIEIILTYSLFVVFLVLVVAFVLLGLTRGFLGIPAAGKDIAPTITAAIMPIADLFIDKVQNLLVVLGSSVLAPQLLAFNTTLQRGLSLSNVENSLTCVVDTLGTLPDINGVVATATAMNSSITTLRGGVNGLVGEINGILASRRNLTTAVNGLSGTVTSLATSLGSLTTALNGVNTSITPVINIQSALVGPGGAPLIPALQADLTKLQPNVGLPNATIIASASGPATISDTSVVGSLNRWVGGNMNSAPTEQIILIGRLSAINDSVAGVLGTTNFSTTADRLLAIDALATTMRTVHIPALNDSIAAAEAAVNALPRSSTVLPFVYSIDNTTRAISFGGIITQLSVVRNVLASLPSIPSLITLVDSAANAANVLPCANGLLGEVRRLNATLFALPSTFNGFLDVFDSINGTVNSALSQLTTIRSMLNSTQTQINSVNVTSYIVDATAAWGTVNSSLLAFNMPSIISRVTSLDTSIPVNFTALRASLASLNSTLATVTLNTSLATTLRSFESDKVSFIANISTVLADMRVVQQGYCSLSTTTLCRGDPDCPGGTCVNQGLFRCSASATTPCNTDSACGSGRCLADIARAIGVKVGLDLMAQAPSTTPSLNTLTSMSASTSAVDLGGIRASITAANASIAAVSTGSITTQLASVNNSLNQLNTDTVSSAVSSVQSAVNAVDFGSFLPQITSMGSTIGSLQSQVNNFGTVIRNLVRSLSRFLNVDLGTTATRLSAASLNAARTTGGAGGLVTAFIGPLQDTLSAFQPNTTGTNASALLPIPSINLTSALPFTADTMNRYTGTGSYSSSRTAGFIHFAYSAAFPDKAVAADDATANTVFTNNAGASYPNSRLCLTDACIRATVDTYTSLSIGQITNGRVPLSIAPLALLNLVWLLPAAVVILGIAALFSRFCCRRSEWQKCPASCMTGCIMIQTPICFCIAAFLFSMALLIGDVCASSRNIPYSFVVTATPDLCTYVSGSYAPTTGVCTVSRSLSLPSPISQSLDINAPLDFPGIARGLLGDGQCGSTDPWAPALSNALSAVRGLPFPAVQRLLNSDVGGFGTPSALMRPPLLNFVYNATNVTTAALMDWVADFTGTVTTCPRINNVVVQSLGVVCCVMYQPLYWLASVFYLIAWTYCCCGLPAGILGRKRLVTHPWGALAKKAAPPGGAGGGDLGGASVMMPGAWGDAGVALHGQRRQLDADTASRLATPDAVSGTDATVTASAIAAADAAVAAAAAGGGGSDGTTVVVPVAPHPNVTVRNPRPVSAGSAPIGHGMIDAGVDGGDFGSAQPAGHHFAPSAFPPNPVGPQIMPGVGGVPGYPYMSPTAAALAAAGGGGRPGSHMGHHYGPSGGMPGMMPAPFYGHPGFPGMAMGGGPRGSMAGSPGVEMAPLTAAAAGADGGATFNPFAAAGGDPTAKRPGSAGVPARVV